MSQDRKKSKSRKKKRKLKPLTAVKAAKSAARATLGSPRPAIRHESTRERKQGKHKITLPDLLAESD